jgi:ribosomal protein L18
MPKKRGDRAHKTAAKRARRDRRRLARDETVREEHTRLVVERSHDPRFTQRIRQDDGTTVYQWPVDSPQDKYLREAMEHQADRFRKKFGRDPGPEDPIFFDPAADEPVRST